MIRLSRLILPAVVITCTQTACPQGSYQPSTENLEARKWFQDAKFGLFIHWGVYSVLGDGEWAMQQQSIPIGTYEKVPTFFNPTQFDATEWVRMAKAAGMKYITITSKHHDGFAMFDSKISDYDIVDRTPYRKDVLKMLAEACQKEGIKLFFYYSQLDWHHPDYYPRGRTGGSYTGRTEDGDWHKYLDYMDAQLTELLTNYGPIGGIWFDGMWDKPEADWRLQTTYQLIHRLQPSAMIGSNHHRTPIAGEDFQMFEKDLPGHNTTGFAPDQTVGMLPRETCETINNSWGFNLKDDHHKSAGELIQYLVKAAGYDANFLLNVGPMPNGKIQPEHMAALSQVGAWLERFAPTIYGTRGGPLSARDWGVTTQKGNKVYVHILSWHDNSILIPSWGKSIRSARLFADQSSLAFTENKYGILLTIPEGKWDETDTVVELETK